MRPSVFTGGFFIYPARQLIFFCILQPEKHELMRSLLLYRILTYILLAVAGFFALMLLSILPAALANPIMLLPVFLLACLILYSYTSSRFLHRGIYGGQYCKPQLRDLIRVNSFFSMGMAVFLLMQAIMLLGNPQLREEVANQALDTMPAEAKLSREGIISLLRFIERFFLIYGISLLTHIIITYRLLRQYRQVFEVPGQDQE